MLIPSLLSVLNDHKRPILGGVALLALLLALLAKRKYLQFAVVLAASLLLGATWLWKYLER